MTLSLGIIQGGIFMKNANFKIVAVILAVSLFFTIITSNTVSIASVAMLFRSGGNAASGTVAGNASAENGTGSADVVTPGGSTGNNSTGTETPADAAESISSGSSGASGTSGGSSGSSSGSSATNGTTSSGTKTNGEPSTKAEIVAAYATVYNKTKATGTFLGKASMKIEDVKLDGKDNSSINSLLGSALNQADTTDMPLPPDSETEKYMTCLISADDIETATYKNNGNGTATIYLKPKRVVNPKLGKDPQGKMLNVIDDFTATMTQLESYGVSWASGDANSNTKADTYDGCANVTYNLKTNLMTSATYILVTHISIEHVNFLLFRDKSLTAVTTYTQTFPQ